MNGAMVAGMARWAGLLLVVLYALAMLATAILVAIVRPHSHASLVYTLGMNCALVGASIVLLNPVLAARLRWIERPFGLDMVLRYHKAMAWFAALLLVLHPVLLAQGGSDWSLIVGGDVPWNVWVGRLVLMAILVNAIVSEFAARFGLGFQTWRWTHNVLVLSLLGLAFTHSYVTGSDMGRAVTRIGWPIAFGVVSLVYLYHKVFRSLWMRCHRYKVVEVIPETADVYSVRLVPPEGHNRYDFVPGQFHFIKFYRAKGLPREEHHWTISWSPSRQPFTTSTIKESGDFTATIRQTRPGDSAEVLGPFGRFSHVLYPREKDLVFIAAGIGITPFMSMIRHMQDTRDDRSVLLLYANRREPDIVFRRELDEISQHGPPRLRVVHVLSQPGHGWEGERGHIDGALIGRHCREGTLTSSSFYVCTPARMAASLISHLRGMGVSSRRIHCERFWL